MLTLFGSGRPNAWASAYGPAGGHLGTLSDISDDDVEKFANELLEALQAKREGRMMSETDNA
jgi:NAD kinase